jgi:bisphosphoglycerate-independent phosphoglycerate mutase (AlkP superfamily)
LSHLKDIANEFNIDLTTLTILRHVYINCICNLLYCSFRRVLYKFCNRGDDLEASRIQQKLQALEERAEELDKLRTSTISSISYINDRNRKKNVEEAEKAIMVCCTDSQTEPDFTGMACATPLSKVKKRI